jgi:ribosomal protein S18 acetylase RimI-like enzyme
MTISIDPAAEATTIRLARDHEVERLSRVLALAFYDDPVFGWFFAMRPGRFARLTRFFRFSLEHMTMPYGHVHTTDGLAGAALWVPPGEGEIGALETVRMLPEMLRIHGRETVKALRGLSIFDEHHPHDVDHWYLLFLGVTPDWRGAGLGTALMQPMLDRADREGMPIYLDATSARNRGLYERHGFEVIGELNFPDGPTAWAMWREPR